MRRLLTQMLTIVTLALFASWPSIGMTAAHAHGEGREITDGDKARAALERGEVIPLEQVLASLEGRVDGEISSIELEKEHGAWVYEFKVISPRGRMMEVHVDAKTGGLIEKKGE